MKLTLRQALKMATYFSAKNDLRYFLNGVHIIKKDGIVTVESTNGHTAFQTKDVENDHVIGDDIDVIIPIEAVNFALRLDKKEDLFLDGNKLGRLEFAPIEANYPDFEKFIVRNDDEYALSVFGFNPEYIGNIGKAIKSTGRYGFEMRMKFADARGLLQAYSQNLPETIFIVMPLNIS